MSKPSVLVVITPALLSTTDPQCVGDIILMGNWEITTTGQKQNSQSAVSRTWKMSKPSVPVRKVSHHTCAVLDNGSAMCWGYNSNGQLGDGTTSLPKHLSVCQVQGLLGAKTISAGLRHTCAVLDNGSAMCWGRNLMDNWGISSPTNKATPGTVINLTNVRLNGINQSLAVTNVDNGTAPTARSG